MKLFIASLIISCFFIDCFAQNQYEFAVVDFQPFDRVLQVSINGETFQESVAAKNEVKGEGDVNFALKEVARMGQNGWEVFQTTTVAGHSSKFKGYVFYLRRKVE